MNILVHMDENDIAAWQEIKSLYNAAIKDNTKTKDLKIKTDYFWHNMIEKYGILRNKQLTVNELQNTICSFSSVNELRPRF